MSKTTEVFLASLRTAVDAHFFKFIMRDCNDDGVVVARCRLRNRGETKLGFSVGRIYPRIVNIDIGIAQGQLLQRYRPRACCADRGSFL